MRRGHMRMVAILGAGPTMHHHAMWRHPDTDNGFLRADYYEHIARILEQGMFDGFFFADGLGARTVYRNGYEASFRLGGQMYMLDPVALIAIMGRVTSHLGLGITMSANYVHAYQLAKTLATLDMLSSGRVAWNIVTTGGLDSALNFGRDDTIDRQHRYDLADEVVEACMKLWGTWDDDALIIDKASGIFADPARVRYANYEGKWVKTRGPLQTPRTPQGHPVLMQAGGSPRGRDFAARWAELVFTIQHSKEGMKKYYDDVRERVAKFGREPDDCLILPEVDPVVGETRAIAEERRDYMNSQVSTEIGLQFASAHTGIDLSKFPADKPLEDLEVTKGSQGVFDILMQGTKAENLTLGEAARRYAISAMCPQLVGTAADIADQLEDMFNSRVCDGFIISPSVFPGTFEQISRAVVPELQKRGLMRTEYRGKTLRENLRL
jgi:FMN-dependent oxidoreductase (nitrilotriacetate monooxygenase family)